MEVREAFCKVKLETHGAKLVSRPLFFPNEVCPASLKPRWKLGSSKACGIVGLSVPKRKPLINRVVAAGGVGVSWNVVDLDGGIGGKLKRVRNLTPEVNVGARGVV